MTRLDPDSSLTTAEIDALAEQVRTAYHAAPSLRTELRLWRQSTVAHLYSFSKPSRRRYAARELARALGTTLAELHNALDLAESASTQAVEITRLRTEVTCLQAQLAERQITCARVPQTTEITIPAQVVQVCAPLQQQALAIIGRTGMGRAWRIAERLVATGLTVSQRSGDNAIGELVRAGLLADYQERGQVVRWAAEPGGTRRLVTLSETGRTFYRAAYGAEPVESEIPAIARAQQSVAHGIGILEARDLLTAAGYAVEADPAPLLADPAAPLGERSQPDLVLIAEGVRWPVEVQREVHPRRVRKLAKALELGGGRLILILFHAAKREQQQAILEQARVQLPPGVILLISLTEMTAAGWTWSELRTA